MAGTIGALRLFQWGIETPASRGTAVPATSKIAIETGIDFEGEDRVERPQLAKGLLTSKPGDEVVVARGTRFTIPDGPVIYDQLQHWLAMALKGDVTATSGNGVPYTYTFIRSLTADPAPDSFTIERRLSDGTTPIDNEWTYCLLSGITFKGAVNESVRFSATGFARRIQSSTLTAALAMPTIEIPPVPLMTVYIDAAWANLGVTQVVSQVLGFTLDIKTGFKPLPTLDGRTDLDFTTHILDPREVSVDLTLLAILGGQFATEKTAAEAQTLRAVRLDVQGTASRQLTIDMMLKHEQGTIQKIDEQDGQDVVSMKFVNSTDGTNLLQAVLVNAAADYT